MNMKGYSETVLGAEDIMFLTKNSNEIKTKHLLEVDNTS